jgi:hypothetical protein
MDEKGDDQKGDFSPPRAARFRGRPAHLPSPGFLTLRELARALRLSVEHLRERCAAGDIPALRPDRSGPGRACWLVPRSYLDDLHDQAMRNLRERTVTLPKLPE